MRLVVAATLLFVTLAPRSLAEQVAVVVDRGRGAEAHDEALATEAATLVTTFKDRGLDTHLYVYGTRSDGRMRAAELKGDPTKALLNASQREGWQFEGPTDPRHALHTAVRRNRSEEALLVFLVGPFEGDGDDEDAREAEEALATWNVRAPVGSRAFAVGLGDQRAALVAEAEGWVGKGTFVLDAGEATVDAHPFSPLARDPLTARVRIPVQVLTVGGGAAVPLLRADSAREGDRLLFLTDPDDPAAIVTLERPASEQRVATLAFRGSDDPSVVWFADVPGPRTFQWADLAPDARLESPGSPQVLPFAVRSGAAGTRYETTYRIVRSATRPAPVWTWRLEDGEAIERLEVEFGTESARDDTTTFLEVTVAYTPKTGRPLDREGTLVLSSEGFPSRFEIPLRIEVPPGRAAVRLEALSSPLPLPRGEGDAPWVIAVESENENLPTHVRVKAIVRPPEAAPDLVATLQSRGGLAVTWDLTQPVDLRVGATYDLGLALAEGVRAREADLALALVPQAGVEGEARGRGRVVGRNPAVVLESGTHAYRVEDDEVVGDPPLVLRLDPDGGSGAWLRTLAERSPTVESDPNGPVTWSLRRTDADRWILEATGSWRGERGNTFTARTEASRPTIEWDGGRSPGAVPVPIEVPPRWGAAGWILVALAALAVLLAGWGVTQLRPVPLEGTLLYTVEGRERAVGHLDLAAAGRRTVAIRADRGGRLSLEGAGDAIAMLRPTRVGGLLVAVAGDAASKEAEHLLVDGLTLRIAGHRLRFVSGRPDDAAAPVVEAPDGELLGPEFDLASGRIEALGGSGPPDDGPHEETDDADGPPVRSQE